MRVSSRRGSWSIAADSDWLDGFTRTPGASEVVLAPSGAAIEARHVRLVVDLRKTGSGLSPRALLGAEFVPGGHQVRAAVPSDGPIQRDGLRYPALQARGLIPGLPDEFVSAVLAGLRRGAGGLPPGVVRVRQSGYDPVDSSEFAFRNAANLLAKLVSARIRGRALSADLLTEQWDGAS